MRNLFKINALFLFLTLSVGLILVSFEDTRLLLTGEEPIQQLRPDIDINDQVSFPNPGNFEPNDIIRVYNPHFEILFSHDGGDHFLTAGKELNLNEFKNQDIRYRHTSIRWQHPEGKFPELKSIVLKLRHKNKMIETPKKVVTYFNKLDTDLPVISLSVKTSHLFDEYNGLMVYGVQSWQDSSFYKDWWYRSANFKERGLLWERPANFQYFVNGVLQFEQNCGIRISGNATRYFPQKSIRIYAGKEYGGDHLDLPFWGKDGIKKYTSLLLRNSGNDNLRTLFADLLIHNLAEGSNVHVQKGKPVLVFINGNFWGVYNLRERIDRYFLAKKIDSKKKDITILDTGKPLLDEGDENELTKFNALLEKVNSRPMSAELYDEIKQEISLNSFTDYIIIETFCANQDWPFNNSCLFKAKGGKWQWMINDLDYSLAYPGESNLYSNVFDKLKNGSTFYSVLYNGLMAYDEFKTLFKKRALEILDQNFSDNLIRQTYDELKAQYEEVIDMQIRRWSNIDSVKEWEINCENNLNFLLKRREIYIEQINSL